MTASKSAVLSGLMKLRTMPASDANTRLVGGAAWAAGAWAAGAWAGGRLGGGRLGGGRLGLDRTRRHHTDDKSEGNQS